MSVPPPRARARIDRDPLGFRSDATQRLEGPGSTEEKVPGRQLLPVYIGVLNLCPRAKSKVGDEGKSLVWPAATGSPFPRFPSCQSALTIHRRQSITAKKNATRVLLPTQPPLGRVRASYHVCSLAYSAAVYGVLSSGGQSRVQGKERRKREVASGKDAARRTWRETSEEGMEAERY
jgi:hypothetical protein